MVNLLELVPPKVKGQTRWVPCWFPLRVRRSYPGETAGWWRRAWPGGAYRETKCGHQSRFSPKTSKWHIFSFTKCKGKPGSLNPFKFKSQFFLTCCFFCCSLPPGKMSIQVPSLVFGFLGPMVCQKNHQSRFNPSILGKTFTNATRPKKE